MTEIIILSYVSRSGSTYLSNFLSRNPDICVLPEANILTKRLLSKPASLFVHHSEFLKDLAVDPKLKNWHIPPETIMQMDGRTNFDVFIEILKAYRDRNKPRASKLLFKEGQAIFSCIDYMASQKMNFKFLMIIRDGRAVYASQRTSVNSTVGIPMEVSPIAAARRWGRFIRSVEKYNALPNFFLVRYESLILDNELTLRLISEFLDYKIDSFSSNAADLTARIPVSQQHLHSRINKLPDPSRVNQWREEVSEGEIYLFEKHAANELSMFYNLTGPKITLPKEIGLVTYFKLKELFRIALFGIIKRFRRLW